MKNRYEVMKKRYRTIIRKLKAELKSEQRWEEDAKKYYDLLEKYKTIHKNYADLMKLHYGSHWSLRKIKQMEEE